MIPAQTTSSTPFAKLVELGDTLIGAYAGDVTRQRRQFGTGDPMLKADGRPAKEEIIHLIAMPGTTAKTGSDESYQPIEPGDHVRYSVNGYKWGQVIDGRKALAAVPQFKVAAGRKASGDVYTFKLIGWSATTENPGAAQAAGFVVVDGRIVMRTDDEHERWVLNQIKKGANTNAGKDFEITVRRSGPGDATWEAKADELYLTKPWERTGDDEAAPVVDDDEAPF